MKEEKLEPTFLILTIGHSNHLLEKFLELLKKYDVEKVVDIRTIPKSRHNPQFNKDSLHDSLKKVKISYIHLPGLGGLRHSRKDSINIGWKNVSFRGFADYMQTEEFVTNLDKLIELAKNKQIAIMCAEAVPWRCHRSLIADALSVRGNKVEHIMSMTQKKEHTLIPFAKVQGTQITYPVENELFSDR